MSMKSIDLIAIRGQFLLAFLTWLILLVSVPANAQVITKSSLINQSQLSDNLLQQGKQLYDRGQLAAAVRVWQRAKQEFIKTKQLANLIRSNNYLATVYQDLGNWDDAQNAIANNLDLLEQLQPQISRRNTAGNNFTLLQAQTFNTQGSWQLKQGKGEKAFSTWQRTEAMYRSLADNTGIILSQINQVQALQTLGFYRRSQTILDMVQQQLDSLPDSQLKIAVLHSLGVVTEVAGDIEQSQQFLNQSLTLAQQLNSANDIAESLFRLGNVARTQQDNPQALAYYQQAIATRPSSSTQLQARLNQLSLLIATGSISSAQTLIAPIQAQLDQFPPSRAALYARVNFARSLIQMGNPEVEKLLVSTIEQATELDDVLAQAYALGTLGNWYERNQHYDRAVNLTNQALSLSTGINQTTLAATFYWQQGRILKAQGNFDKAIAAYQEAVNHLENIHQDLIAVNNNLQFSFRQQVEPIYRQLVELLLHNVDNLSPEQKQDHLERSRLAIEALKQKELENFFRIACLDIQAQDIEQIDTQAAVIYPILLEDSIEVIISIPGKPLAHYRTEVDVTKQSTTFNNLLQYLNPVFKSTDILPTAQKLYAWLIRPAEAILEQQQTETLVFVLDGSLRSLPMAVLHDGQQYLVEKYNLALTPGLQLLRRNTSALLANNILTGGITQSRQGYSALPGVETEITNIRENFSAQILLNQEFTHLNLQEQTDNKPISILHLATHGQFSSSANDTFILTWDGRINVNEFDRLLNQRENKIPLELLVLSACKTATGDEQAILGLAGMAVRSGAKSTIASLWSVSDRSTAQLMAHFYRHLDRPNISKASALRNAQLALLRDKEYQHPYFWSLFVLVGNWQ